MNTNQHELAGESQRVLIVDDDRNLTTLLSATLKSGGLEVLSAPDGTTALDVIERESIDALILDLRMPGMDGRTLFHEVRARGHQIPVLIASAYGARAAQQELGAEASIDKPFDPERLLDAIRRIVR
jgi:DNA-binding response OmpR family regulator